MIWWSPWKQKIGANKKLDASFLLTVEVFLLMAHPFG